VSSPPSRPLPSAVVARLRAAGCVFAEDEAALLVAAAATRGELATLVERRVGGEPLEYVLGWAEFCGLRLVVEPGVFVPRRRTGLLVQLAAARAPRPAVVVDLCCGSGAVGVALAARLGEVELHAVDVDAAAVRCARRNVGALGRVHQGDLYDPLPDALRGRVDVVVANAPYVPTGELRLMPPEARDHEARAALDGGADGLAVYRRVCAGAADWLRPGGSLFVETSRAQAPAAVAIMAASGLSPLVQESDELAATVVVGS
jgi:release factor glutamine methyltransferase